MLAILVVGGLLNSETDPAQIANLGNSWLIWLGGAKSVTLMQM